MDAIKVDIKKCNFNNACLRVCPTYAFNIKTSKNYVQINSSRCIYCGHCIEVCPTNAIEYPDGLQNVKNLLATDNKNIAILDTSIPAEFSDITDYRKLSGMIRKLGFDYVIESTFTVDLLAKKYHNLINNFQGKYYIFSNCPAIINLVNKFYPSLTENLAPFLPPHIAASVVARKIFGSKINVTWISPCIAAKIENNEKFKEKVPDAVLTFKEIRELFTEYDIKETPLEFNDFDPPSGYTGALFPLPEGFIYASDLNEGLFENKIITASGRDNVIEALNTFETNAENLHHHLNLYYCEGCIMGPGMSKKNSKFLKETLIKDYVNKRIGRNNIEEFYKNIVKYQDIDLSAEFVSDNQRLPPPPEEKVQEVLKIIGKENIKNLPGCRVCGYASCYDLAVAVAQSIAKPELCMNYSLKTKQEYIKTLKQSNEKLQKNIETINQTNTETEKKLNDFLQQVNITDAIIQKLNLGIVVVDENLKIIKSNDWFIKMLGEEVISIAEIIPGLKGADIKSLLPPLFHNLFSFALSGNGEIINKDVKIDNNYYNISIFPIKEKKIASAIIRDMSSPEVMSEEIVRRINEVIDTNLEMVQKIAFLLGESASNIERMLNSIIETNKP